MEIIATTYKPSGKSSGGAQNVELCAENVGEGVFKPVEPCFNTFSTQFDRYKTFWEKIEKIEKIGSSSTESVPVVHTFFDPALGYLGIDPPAPGQKKYVLQVPIRY